MENENNITGGKLICEVCNVNPYDTTDKVDGEITLVCFTCKDKRLTERNTGRDFEGDTEGEDSIAMDDKKVIDEILDDEYAQYIADRFGVGGRY